MRYESLAVTVGILVSFICCFTSTAYASFIRSSAQEDAVVTDEQAVDVVKAALEKEWIAERLAELGLSSEEIVARLDELTENELAEIEELLQFRDNIQAGGSYYEYRNGQRYEVMTAEEAYYYRLGGLFVIVILLLSLLFI